MATNTDLFGDGWKAEVERRVLSMVGPDSDKSPVLLAAIIDSVAKETGDLDSEDEGGLVYQIDYFSQELEMCAGCDEAFLPDQQGIWSNTVEAYVCDACVETASSSASTAYLMDPEIGEPEKYYVTDYETVTEYGDEADNLLERHWRSSSAWRGYYETSPRGDSWREVTSGWTTGDWGDAVSDSKRSFNEWTDAVLKGEVILPCAVWLCFDPTSNVFSTGVGVFVPANFDGDLDIPKF